jgi:two-component system NarL family sensor kinase
MALPLDRSIQADAREGRAQLSVRTPALTLLGTPPTERGHVDMSSRKRPQRRRAPEYVLNLGEEDRRRIALKLRDSASEGLAALKMNLGAIKQSDAQLGPKASKALAECLALADDCGREIHDFSQLLYPPLLEEFGLVSALRSYLEALRRRFGLRLQFAVDQYFRRGRLPKELERALFHVAQEGLSNVRLHSGSNAAKIKLRRARNSGEVLLCVSDHGRGIPASVMRAIETGEVAGFGISEITERVRQLGGELKVESNRRGTVVTAVVPLPSQRSSSETGSLLVQNRMNPRE